MSASAAGPGHCSRGSAVVLACLMLALIPPIAAAQETICLEDAVCLADDLDQSEPAAAPPRPGVFARAWRVVRAEARRYGRDSAALLKAPLHWQKQDWSKAGGAVLILGGLMLADRSIESASQRQRSDLTDRVAAATTSLGGQYGFHASATLLGLGLLFHHDNMRDTGREALEAGLFAHVLNRYFLKRAFGRKRPFETDGATVFVPGSSYDSFPSGHATEAFAVASVIAARSKSWIIPSIAYAAATVVAMDRINTRDHFASDVVAGAFLGTAIGHFLVHRHHQEEAGVLSKAELEIVPIGNGLAARVRF